MFVPLGPLEPDKSRYNAGATSVAINCMPIADGWAPMPGLTVVTEALTTAPRGVVLVRTSTGGYQIYVGEENRLNKLNTTIAPYTWEDVSRLVGGAYALPPGDSWSFVHYGSRLVAFELADTPQFIDVDSGTDFANLPGSPPTARFGWVAGDFLVTGYNASFPNRVRWSAFNNSEAWELQVRGASLQDILSGAEVQGGIGSDNGAIIFQRNQIASMVKTVDVSAAFDFSVVPNPYRGTIAPYSIAATNAGLIFYLSEDGFYMGIEGQAIGAEKVDRWFLNGEVDLDFLQEVSSAVDPFNKIVWFNYQKIGGSKARLGYNWQLQRWCYADTNVSQIAALATPGLTWDGLDALYATIDDVDEPFDSRLFAGGRPTMAGFDSDFKLGWFTGANSAVTLETADVPLIKGKDGVGQRSFLKSATLIGDCADFTITVGTSDYPGGPVTWHGPFSPSAATGKVYFKDTRLPDAGGVSALFHRFRLNIPEGAEWTVVTGLEADANAEGTR
jgi:hypothetical protein